MSARGAERRRSAASPAAAAADVPPAGAQTRMTCLSRTLAGAVALPAPFLIRSASHPTPVMELALFRIRSFSVANAGGVVFAIGFFPLLLGNVLFLTTALRYSALGAGVALTPGPIAAAAAAPVAGRLAAGVGIGLSLPAFGSAAVAELPRPSGRARQTSQPGGLAAAALSEHS